MKTPKVPADSVYSTMTSGHGTDDQRPPTNLEIPVSKNSLSIYISMYYVHLYRSIPIKSGIGNHTWSNFE